MSSSSLDTTPKAPPQVPTIDELVAHPKVIVRECEFPEDDDWLYCFVLHNHSFKLFARSPVSQVGSELRGLLLHKTTWTEQFRALFDQWDQVIVARGSESMERPRFCVSLRDVGGITAQVGPVECVYDLPADPDPESGEEIVYILATAAYLPGKAIPFFGLNMRAFRGRRSNSGSEWDAMNDLMFLAIRSEFIKRLLEPGFQVTRVWMERHPPGWEPDPAALYELDFDEAVGPRDPEVMKAHADRQKQSKFLASAP